MTLLVAGLVTPLSWAHTQPVSPQHIAAEQSQTAIPTDPEVHAKLNLPKPADDRLPTLWLIGDSTVRNGHGDGGQGQWGWGEPLVSFFDPTKINVVNRAIGGRSSRTYLTEGHWKDVFAMIKPGDTVLIQFGHNDGGVPDEPSRARASLPGLGEETLEIENPILHQHEVVHTFGWYLRQYVVSARKAGATPILCSLIPRKTWREGKIVRASDSYAGWTRQVAEEEHAGLIDLNRIVALEYDALGEANVEPLFADPHTHTSLAGAQLNAAAVVIGLRRLANDPVAADFSAKGKAVKP